MTVEERTREVHPLTLFAPEGARLLMLGSFPPPRERWRMDFFYPNFQNDMWRIFGLVFFGDKSHFLTDDGRAFREAELRRFLTERGIAIWDTAMEVSRLQGNASDKFLEVLRPIDLRQTLALLPSCRAIAVTGQKALDTLLTLVSAPSPPPKTGEWTDAALDDRHFRLYRMPSSSRAYPLSVEKKAEKYQRMFEEMGLK
jgi:G:T/U mismatch-specific DNA glycosylase